MQLKLRKTVLKVLKDKHPEMTVPDLTNPEWPSFERYKQYPAEIFVNCNKEIVQVVAGKLSSRDGPSPLDRLTQGKWLLNFGTASQVPQEEIKLQAELMCNQSPPLAMIIAPLVVRMIALEKNTGVQPVAIAKA